MYIKSKKLLSIVVALILILSISSVAMAKEDNKPVINPSVNITGEGPFDLYVDAFGPYVYDGVVSVRTTKDGYLDINIVFTLTSGNGFLTEMGTLTAIEINEHIPEYTLDESGNIISTNYSTIQYKDKSNKLLTTTIYADISWDVTFTPAEGEPVTLTGPSYVRVGDNINNSLDLCDYVTIGDAGFLAPYYTLNQQK